MPKRSPFHKALVAAIVDPGQRLPPPDPIRRKKPRTGATGEIQSWEQDDRNGDDNWMAKPKKAPKKTTEGYEPWQWDADDPRRNRRKA